MIQTTQTDLNVLASLKESITSIKDQLNHSLENCNIILNDIKNENDLTRLSCIDQIGFLIQDHRSDPYAPLTSKIKELKEIKDSIDIFDSYESIQNEISRIQFHTSFDRDEKNRMIKDLEKKLERFF